MQVIPAIDLMNEKIVRLTKGDPEQATFYDNMGTPVEIAANWKARGAERLHIIDLDAAFGKPDNLKSIMQIVQETSMPIQVGGGIRSVESVERILNAGIEYVILGSLAFKNPSAITQLLAEFDSNRIIVALDNKNGIIMVEGWTSSTTFTLMAALEAYSALGIRTFLITSITKDGTLSGPDLDSLNEACKHPGVDIIAAGGISELADLVALSRIGVKGAVIGKALYEERFTLEQAIKTVHEEQKKCL
jgi:phosphoribosylformimino-5-aminoimidazole carboxamide ribotide isomerase